MLDVPCMGCGEPDPSMVVVAMDEGEAHGHGHGRLGEMMLGFGDVLTRPWGCSMCSNLAWDGLRA